MLRQDIVKAALSLEEFNERSFWAILNKEVQLVLVLEGLEKLDD